VKFILSRQQKLTYIRQRDENYDENVTEENDDKCMVVRHFKNTESINVHFIFQYSLHQSALYAHVFYARNFQVNVEFTNKFMIVTKIENKNHNL